MLFGFYIVPFLIAALSGIILKYDLCLYGEVFYAVSMIANLIMLIRSFTDEDVRASRREFL